jgi:hypothetical protein
MNLKSFGCSFIYGTDLADAGDFHNKGDFSRLTWPALYAESLGHTYESLSRPGSGNLQIADRCLAELDKDTADFYIVSWTWIDRYDYTGPEGPWWHTLTPTDTDRRAKCYYRDLHSQLRDKLTSLMNIKLIIDTLQQKNRPFIMTYMDELLFETEWHTNPTISYLQQYVKPHMTLFDGQTFLEWSRKNGYPESATWHPLEPAHRAAADYMLQFGVNKV